MVFSLFGQILVNYVIFSFNQLSRRSRANLDEQPANQPGEEVNSDPAPPLPPPTPSRHTAQASPPSTTRERGLAGRSGGREGWGGAGSLLTSYPPSWLTGRLVAFDRCSSSFALDLLLSWFKKKRKMTKNWLKVDQKKEKPLQKTWSFAWKIENRPTYEDFEKKNPNPQLHQIFIPIRKFFCTFLPI